MPQHRRSRVVTMVAATSVTAALGARRPWPMRRVLTGIAIVAAMLGAARAEAQQPAPVSVAVVVRDSAGSVVSGADVSVIRGLNERLASGSTDAHGRVAFSLLPSKDDYQLVARKIGFQRGDQFFRVEHDSVSFDIVLRRSVQALAPVTIKAEEDVKRKSYHIGADEIANSGRVLIDATDIIAKLRPDMICGRSCSPLAGVRSAISNPARKCQGLAILDKTPRSCPVDDGPPKIETNVWVNGQRIQIVALDEMALARQTGLLSGLRPGTMTVLSEISPEHIAEITYADSFDLTVDKIGSQDAIFIVLKPGIAYQPGKPSYVVPVEPSRAGAAPPMIPAYRYRIVGVYDESTGEPIVDAQVTDMQSGTSARTTATGTVSLIFLPEGGSPIRISKPGYADLNMVVEISPANVDPLTLTMAKRPTS